MHPTSHKRAIVCPCNRALFEARQVRKLYVLYIDNYRPSIYVEADRHRTLRLRRECEQALKDEGSVNARFTRDLTSRAKTECLKITEMMCHKLPIELRNLVYEFICIEDQPIPVGPYFHFRPYNRKMDSDRLASALSNGRLRIDHTERADPAILMPYSYVFNPAYVGPIVKVEMQKVYLANNTFSICNVDQGIDTFLRWGSSRRIPDPVMPLGTPFGPGSGFSVVIENALCLIKAGEFVRRLQIRVKCEHYDNHEPWDMAHYRRDLFATECGILRNARITLEPLLFLLQQDQPLELEFIIMTALRPDAMAVECQQRYFINLLQALRNTFYILIYDRGNTKIRIVHHDDKISAFPRDITALWSLTKEQWEQVCNGLGYFSAPIQRF